MPKEDFSYDPMTRPSLTEGGASMDPLDVHMKAFLKAVKSGDSQAMATAFKAAANECNSSDYSEEASEEMG
jgi:hypothetical protein